MAIIRIVDSRQLPEQRQPCGGLKATSALSIISAETAKHVTWVYGQEAGSTWLLPALTPGDLR
jgi:hypothetical protein